MEGLSEKLRFEQRLEGGKDISCAETKKSFPGRESTKYGPQCGPLLSTEGQHCWGRAVTWPDM